MNSDGSANSKHILGISAFYHDSAACLVRDGDILAAAQEERFTRKKHTPDFPVNAIQFCLDQAKITIEDLHAIVFYEKPLLKFERLLETYLSFAPAGIRSFTAAMPAWLKEKLFLKDVMGKKLREMGKINKKAKLPPILFPEHHESHAASAFFPSPFKEAAILCMDGVGEWATTSAWVGQDNDMELLWEIPFPHSLGLLYSAFTYYTGFKVNSGEYKVMGLAPYGEPKFVKHIYDHLIDLKDDGTFKMNMEYFNYCTGLTMTTPKFHTLFGAPPREAEAEFGQREMDLARSIQEVTEEVMLRLARTMHRETRMKNLCLAGGVALNCVGNGRVLREGPFENLWIQPAAGDAGGAIGAALNAWYRHEKMPRQVPVSGDFMKGTYLGPSYTDPEIESELNQDGACFTKYSDHELYDRLSKDLASEKVVGWCQGKMEFGPRSLGGRSIIGDPRSTKMQSIMNLKIKYRESFRPFAPAVLREQVNDYFDLDKDSPYMLLVAPVVKKRQKKMTTQEKNLWGIDLLNVPKSDIPAVTHVDYSARVQTVHEDTNPRFYQLLKSFDQETGCGVLVNTSFNVRGEPIVCSPRDAYRCFMRTEMDVLVIENYVLYKQDQKPLENDSDWRKEFELD